MLNDSLQSGEEMDKVSDKEKDELIVGLSEALEDLLVACEYACCREPETTGFENYNPEAIEKAMGMLKKMEKYKHERQRRNRVDSDDCTSSDEGARQSHQVCA